VLNFLVREDYTPADLFSHSKSLIDLQEGTLSVDDSVWDKPYSNAKLNPLIGHHYSGKHHKAVKGICLITLLYTHVKGVRVPVSYRIYQQGEDKTKNDLFREMLNEVLAWGLSPKLVTGDSHVCRGIRPAGLYTERYLPAGATGRSRQGWAMDTFKRL
jgi:hypothetical protein